MLQLGRDSGCLCLEQRQQGNKVAAKTWGAFHSLTKTFQNLETAANGVEISGKVSRNFESCLSSEMRAMIQLRKF